MKKDERLILCNRLSESCVFLGVDADGRDEVFELLVRVAEERGLVNNSKEFLSKLLEREREMSTSVGLGLAVPHAEVPGAKETFIMAAVLKKPIEYKAIDDEPVWLIFMIGGRPGEAGLHLQLLARIARLARKPELLEKLKSAAKAEDFISALREAENSLYG